MSSIVANIIFDQVFKTIKEKLQEPNVPSVPGTEARVALDLAKAVAPVVVNQTNNEPLWKSRILRGGILALVGLVGGYLGLQITDADLDQGIKAVSDLVTTLGVIYSIYGRLTNKAAPKL
jgi:hypothetical protein